GLTRTLGPLLAGGAVQREVFLDAFPELVRSLDAAAVAVKPIDPKRPPFVGHTAGVNCVAFSPGGKWAVSGGDDQTLRLWDVATGQELKVLIGHTDAVTCVVFSADGKRLLSGGRDTTLRLWEVATGKQLRRFDGHTGRVRA